MFSLQGVSHLSQKVILNYALKMLLKELLKGAGCLQKSPPTLLSYSYPAPILHHLSDSRNYIFLILVSAPLNTATYCEKRTNKKAMK